MPLIMITFQKILIAGKARDREGVNILKIEDLAKKYDFWKETKVESAKLEGATECACGHGPCSGE